MKKNLLFVIIFSFLMMSLWAQTAIPEDVYRQIDAALAEDSLPKVEAILTASATAKWYPKLESYVLKKARQMVIENRLDMAKSVALAVIDNNLDNKEAVDLYQSVKTAIVKRDTEQKAAADAALVAEYKQKVAEPKVTQEIAKTYKTATNAATGRKVYLDQEFNNHYSTISWDMLFGLGNGSFTISPDSKDAKYGLSGASSLFYHGEGFSFGADIKGGAMFVALMGEQGMNWSGEGILSLSVNAIGKYLALRGGYAAFDYNAGSLTLKESLFMTPVAGFGFRDIKMGEKGRFQWTFDYYPGHLSESDMIFAGGTEMVFSSVLADLQDFDIMLNTTLKDTLLLSSGGVTNDSKLILAVGVGNYD